MFLFLMSPSLILVHIKIYLRCSGLSVFLHCTMTNMSSIPIPSMRKGMTVWAGEYQKPMAEHTP